LNVLTARERADRKEGKKTELFNWEEGAGTTSGGKKTSPRSGVHLGVF